MATASDKSTPPSVPAQARQASLRRPEESEGSAILRILMAARLLAPLGILTFSLLVALVAALLLDTGLDRAVPGRLVAVAVAMAIIALGLSAWRLRSKLLRPLVSLEASVGRVCQGDPGATLTLNDTGVLGELVRDVGSLNEELSDLYEDMDSRVARHTTRLAQKTASLKILYDVAASVNQVQDLDELLIRFMRVLKEMVNGLAATVRLVMPDGKMRLVGSIGLDNNVLREEEMLPVQLCLCGIALSPGDIMCVNHAKHCSQKLGREMFDSDEIEIVSVPLAYHDDVLGLYHLFVRKPGISGREDIMELLETIGSHLGMAVAKQQSDDDARRLSIVEERTALAHELHDSLAQTLASLRFQIRMLSDSLGLDERGGGASERARADLQKIRNGVDEAHTELRELLNSFRAPVEQRGLVPALEKVVQRFQQETGIHTFFQCECRQVSLNASEEMQIVRIVQESLANIRKHARAQTVRVLLSCRTPGSYALLVEDDGVGFEHTARKGQPGEHIGLSIMDERARRLGGELRIESEPGEGTRVELTYTPANRPRNLEKSWIV
jgi:two-component system nitrate/nitrite sensor histidine kinase NarX